MVILVFLSLYIVLIFLRWHLSRGGESGGGGGSARRSTGFARLCAQVSGLLRDWMVRLGWRQFSTHWLV